MLEAGRDRKRPASSEVSVDEDSFDEYGLHFENMHDKSTLTFV